MASNEPIDILDGLTHVYECDEQKVSGIIAPKDGIYRENLSVYIKDGNTELASGTTDSNGIFNISFFLPVGQYDPIIKCGNNTESIYENGLRSLACSLTLTSDKNILSAADDDYATLSATLKCTETNQFLSNREITFEITKDNTVVQTLTGQTNSSGVATVTYESQGLGDISVTARIGSILSERYSIEDCIRSSDKEYVNVDEIVNWDLPSQFKLYFTLNCDSSTNQTNVALIRFNYSSGVWCGKGSTANRNIQFNGVTLHQLPVNTDTDYVLSYDNGNCTLTSGADSITTNVSLSKIYLIASQNNNHAHVKNVKIKPL